MKRFFLLISFLLWVQVGYALEKATPFSIPFSQPPKCYGSAVYGFDADSFMKVGFHGKVEWRLSQLPQAVTDWDIQFNKIFFISKEKGLYCYDSQYGFLIWKNNQILPKQFFVKYPYLVVLDKDNHLIGVDFDSGYILWKNNRYFNCPIVLFDSKMVCDYQNKRLGFYSLLTGKLVKSNHFSGAVQMIQDIGKDCLFIRSENSAYVYHQNSTKKELIMHQWSFEQATIYHHYKVYYDPMKKKMISIDLLSLMPKWEVAFLSNEEIIDVLWEDQYAVVFLNNQTITIIDILTGETLVSNFVLKTPLFELKPMRFFWKKPVFCFLTLSQIIQCSHDLQDRVKEETVTKNQQ